MGVIIGRNILSNAVSMIENSEYEYSPQQMTLNLPIQSIEDRDFLERDFLEEAKEIFADDPEVLAYLNTPTEMIQSKLTDIQIYF